MDRVHVKPEEFFLEKSFRSKHPKFNLTKKINKKFKEEKVSEKRWQGQRIQVH